MADQKISQLTGYSTPIPADVVPVVDTTNGITKKIALSDLFTGGNQTLFKALSANDTGGQNVATAQPWFPTAGGVTVAATTAYYFRGKLRLSRSAGVTSHTTGLLFGGTATLTSIAYKAFCNTSDVVTNAAMNQSAIEVATNTTVKAASTSATEQIDVYVEGIVRINAGGTFIPQFQYSAAPGGTPTVLANSFFMLVPLGTGSVVAQGTWA